MTGPLRKTVLVTSVGWAALMLIIVPVINSNRSQVPFESIASVSGHAILGTVCGFDFTMACLLFLVSQYGVDYVLLGMRSSTSLLSPLLLKIAWIGSTIITLLAILVVVDACWSRMRRFHARDAIGAASNTHSPPTGIPLYVNNYASTEESTAADVVGRPMFDDSR